ncbi:hypothetical protein [Streptomyces sp. NBC_01304]|uniref:hypothetical protein n=1 Tax=Streptomyces sp. NBC_01304 TaxID=2903818 RepID=UPI002E15CF2B|nr:hypothetical protein OG430_37340 [Streptomyces sp. NBC_01304]
MYRDPSWDPLPVRGPGRLWLQFLLTTVYAPVHWALFTVLLLAVVALGFVLELISWIPGVEAGLMKLIDLLFKVCPPWPRWFVTLPELRHEGDTAFYRARVDHRLTASKQAADPKTREIDVPLRKYRAVGAGYVAHAAAAHGWELHPDTPYDIRREVKLLRPPQCARQPVQGAG